MAGINWTQEEEFLLKSKCNSGISFKEMANLFPIRTASSLQAKAVRMDWPNKFQPRKYTCNQKFWDEVNNDNSYWAGFVAADGCVRYTDGTYTFKIELSEVDRHQLEALNFYTESEYPISKLKKPSKRGCGITNDMCYTSVNDISWAKGLENNFGIFPRKTWFLKPPPIHEDFFSYWLCGFLDGDGCYHYDPITDMFSISISLAVSEPLEKILEFSNQFPQIRKKKRHVKKCTGGGGKYQYFHLAICGKSAAYMAHYLMSLPCFHMKRKYEYVKNYLDTQKRYDLSLPTYDQHMASLNVNI